MWWVTVPPVSNGSYPHHVGVDSTGDTILHLGVELRKYVTYKKDTSHQKNHTFKSDITCKEMKPKDKKLDANLLPS